MDRRKLRVENGNVLIRGCVVTFVFIVLFFNSFAQNYIHYTTDNGVPSAELYNGLQDKDGFIFINSADGLIRFDGVKFKLFDVTDGLTDNDIVTSVLAENNDLWLSTFNGSVCIYKNNRIYNSYNYSLLKKINHMLDKDKFVRFGYSQNKKVILFQGKAKKFFTIDNGLIKEFPLPNVESIHCIFEFGNYYYITYHKGVCCMDSLGNLVQNQKVNKNLGYLYQNKNNFYSLDYSFNNEFRLYKSRAINHSIKVVSQLKLMNNPTSCGFLVFKENQIYWAASNKVYSSNLNLSSLKLMHEFDNEVEIRGLFKDRQENLWVVTHEDGIYLLPNRSNSGNTIRLIKNSEDFHVFDEESSLALLKNDSLCWKLPGQKLRALKLVNSSVLKSLKVHREHFYFVRSDNKIVTINKISSKKKVFNFPHRPNPSIKDFDLEENFFAISINSEVVVGFLKNLKQVYLGRTTAIEIEKPGESVYIGKLNGVCKLVNNGEVWKEIPLHDSLVGHVLSLEKDKYEILWVLEQNCIKAYYKGRILRTFDYSSGLVSKTISSVEVGNNKLIVSTNKGISVIPYSLRKDSYLVFSIKNYTNESGLNANNPLKAAVYKDALLVKTRKGVVSYNLLNHRSTMSYKPYITSFQANGNEVARDSLVLQNNQNFISISFASLIFGGQPSTYSYRLVEQGNQWQTTENKTCEFAALEPNKYTFQLKANYNDGNKFGSMTELKFEIEPAFWQTLWFKVLIFLLAALLLFYIIYTFWQRRKMSLEAERNFAQLKMQALKAQMNPHFIFNSLNSIQSIVNNGEVELANEYIVQFSTLIRQSLNYSNIDYITVRDEVDFLHNYIQLEQLRFENIFDYSIVVSDDINSSETLLPPMMLQIYVENAIRHGIVPLKDGGFVSVLFELEGEYLKCSIEDNGVGRKEEKINKNKIYTSRGTQLNEERAEMYQTILEKEIFITWTDKLDKAKNRKGTKVQIKIPII